MDLPRQMNNALGLKSKELLRSKTIPFCPRRIFNDSIPACAAVWIFLN